MKVKHILLTINEPEKDLIFIDYSQKGCPKTDYLRWYLGDSTQYDEREVASVLYKNDKVEIRMK